MDGKKPPPEPGLWARYRELCVGLDELEGAERRARVLELQVIDRAFIIKMRRQTNSVAAGATQERLSKEAWIIKKAGPSRQGDTDPPSHAQFILHLFLTLDRQDDVVGDLGQRYAKRLEQHGVRRARLWYWTHTLTLVAATLRERCGGLVKWGAGLEILRRWLGQ